MPTYGDETLHERYAREHADHMARLAKMTPEQIAEMELDLHNALAEVDRLRAQASQGGEAVAWRVTGRDGLTITAQYPEWAEADCLLTITPLYTRPADQTPAPTVAYKDDPRTPQELSAAGCRCVRFGEGNPHWPCSIHPAPAVEPVYIEVSVPREELSRAVAWIEAAKDGVLYSVARDFEGVVGANAEGLGQCAPAIIDSLRTLLNGGRS